MMKPLTLIRWLNQVYTFKVTIPRLSFCIIFKDEISYLPACIESVRKICDEFILVDSGSQDGSDQWANEFCRRTKGAQYFLNNWPGSFAQQRNFAISKATGDWILFLDADERLDHSSSQSIVSAIKDTDISAFLIKIRNYTLDFQEWGFQPEDHQHPEYPYGYIETALHRLFRKNPDIKYHGVIHEKIEGALAKFGFKTKPLDAVIHHIGKIKEREKGLQAKRYDFYEGLALKQILIDPSNAQSHWELGVIYQKQKKWPEAEESFLKAYQMLPHAEEFEASYFMVLYQQSKWKELIEAKPRTKRGAFFQLNAQCEGNIKLVSRILEFKDIIHQSSLVGLEYALRFNLMELVPQFREIAEMKFKNFGIIEFIEGRVLRLQGHYEKAIPLLEKSLSLGYHPSTLELFICLMKLNRPQEVIEHSIKIPTDVQALWPPDTAKILQIAHKMQNLGASSSSP